MEDLDGAVSFHGHLCPMLYLGVRMGGLALKKLERGREGGMKLHAVVEFTSCFADGIQYVTGATFGKNTLHLKDAGKFAASFYDLSAGKGLRLKVRDEVLNDVLKYGRAGKKVKALPPSNRESEAKKLMESGKEMGEWLKTLSDDELFQDTETLPFSRLNSVSLDVVKCKNCGELTLKEYVIKGDAGQICRSCNKS